MASVKNINYRNGIVGVELEAQLASGAYVDVELPANAKDIAIVQAIGADGTVLVSGAATFTAKIFDQAASGSTDAIGTIQNPVAGKIKPAYIRFTAGTGNLAIGTKLVAFVSA